MVAWVAVQLFWSTGIQGDEQGGDLDGQDDTAGQGDGVTPATAPPPPPPSNMDMLTLMMTDFLAAQSELMFAQGKREHWEEQEAGGGKGVAVRKSKREKEKGSLAKFDCKNHPTFQEGQGLLSFLINFEQACKDLGTPQALFVKLLHSQVTGQLAELLA